MPVQGLSEFRSSLQKLKSDIRETPRETWKGLILFAYIRLLEYSPVYSGAYIASHVVYDENGQIVFEHTNRPPANQRFNKRNVFRKPRLDRLERVLNDTEVQTLSISNSRVYAREVEHRHFVYIRAREDIAGVTTVPVVNFS